MIISTTGELRIFSPSNAIDNIDSLSGFINNSEYDFLRDKLGNKLFDSLHSYYNDTVRDNVNVYLANIQAGLPLTGYVRLLYLCQKAVTYDALSRAVSLQAVSINGMGVNVASNDNYKAADRDSINDFKKGCVKEAHSAVNELLQTLESWAIATTVSEDTEENTDTPSDEDTPMAVSEDIPENPEVKDIDDGSDVAPDIIGDPLIEEKEIVELWKSSRYYYLVTTLLIPSAVILQDYFNIYESREKYIQMLPTLRYIQEDILAPIFGDELIDFIALFPWQNTVADRHISHITHNLRKISARYLEAKLTKQSDERHEEARNEAVKLTTRLVEYLQRHQDDYNEDLTSVFKLSPLYVAPVSDGVMEVKEQKFQNNASKSVMFVTPGII